MVTLLAHGSSAAMVLEPDCGIHADEGVVQTPFAQPVHETFGMSYQSGRSCGTKERPASKASAAGMRVDDSWGDLVRERYDRAIAEPGGRLSTARVRMGGVEMVGVPSAKSGLSGQSPATSSSYMGTEVSASLMQAEMAVESVDWEEAGQEAEGGAQIEVDELIANDVGQAMNFVGDKSSNDGERFLFDHWIAMTVQQGRRHSVLGNVEEQAQAAQLAASEYSARQAGATAPSDKDVQDATGWSSELTKRYMYELFFVAPRKSRSGENSPRVRLQEQHKNLGRVLANIFVEHRMAPGNCVVDINDTESTVESVRVPWHRRFRDKAERIVNNDFFVGVMMLLTIYALFAPDIVRWCGDKQMDSPLAIVNSVVFLLYLAEMLLHGVSSLHVYFCSVVFFLDLLALFSIFLDTWFMQADVLDEKSSQSARMARSARLTRLARITRIARITRMFPIMLKWLRRSKVNMARGIIQRRIWRACMFLDTDLDGIVNFFDFKLFYGSLMQRCNWLSEDDMAHMLARDVPLLMAKEAAEAELTFEEFEQTFVETQLGADVIERKVLELESRSGVLRLIRTVSDRSALKLCVGTLVLLSTLSILVPDDVDMSPHQGLAQLDAVARIEHAGGPAEDPLSARYLCEQIGLFSTMAKPMLLVLDGWIYLQDGVCLTTPTRVLAGGLMQLLDGVSSATELRSQEVLQLCWPDLSSCASARSAALLDHSKTYRTGGAWSLLDTVVTILLLLLFVMILNQKITGFSKALLYPLRTLLDDMVVLTDLELADLDEEELKDVALVQNGETEEFVQLQASFKEMRSAIRSWSKFVPPAIVQRLFSTGLEAKIGVVKLTATILFCDINGFEGAVKGLPPAAVLDLLSKVTGVIADVIQANAGTFLEFIGDEVLAVYNAPKQQKNHVYAAVLTCLQIHTAVNGLTYKRADGAESAIQCRCGVHSGPIFAGNIGSHQRMKYGLLGDGINLTARLKGLNSRYKTLTLVSQSVVDVARAQKPQRVHFRPVDMVAVKGKSEPTVVFEPLAGGLVAKPRLLAALAMRHAEAFGLYQKRRFREARALFEEVAEGIEGTGVETDHPSRMLATRCAGYIRNPPPPEWDGVERLVKKSFEEPQAAAGGSQGSESSDLPAGVCAVGLKMRRVTATLQPQSPGDRDPMEQGAEDFAS